MKWTIDMHDWHNWFAWYPILIEHSSIWLETVQRKRIDNGFTDSHPHQSWFIYRKVLKCAKNKRKVTGQERSNGKK